MGESDFGQCKRQDKNTKIQPLAYDAQSVIGEIPQISTK
jgi:hypothetical protein